MSFVFWFLSFLLLLYGCSKGGDPLYVLYFFFSQKKKKEKSLICHLSPQLPTQLSRRFSVNFNLLQPVVFSVRKKLFYCAMLNLTVFKFQMDSSVALSVVSNCAAREVSRWNYMQQSNSIFTLLIT